MNLIILIFSVSVAQAHIQEKISHHDFLEQFKKSSVEFLALEEERKVIEQQIKSRQLYLSPQLNIDSSVIEDQLQTTANNAKNRQNSTSLSISQALRTGTHLSGKVFHGQTSYRSSNLDPISSSFDWELNLRQDLLKNSFGYSTRKQLVIDELELKISTLQITKKQIELLQTISDLYWGLAETQHELKTAQENIERSRRMLSWIRQRVERSAAETLDLYQTEVLLTQREFQLNNLTQKQRQLRKKIYDLMGDSLQQENWAIEDSQLLNSEPSPNYKLDLPPESVHSYSYLIQSVQIEITKSKSQIAADQSSPALSIYASYGKNSLTDQFSKSLSSSFNDNYFQSKIGLTFQMSLDRHLAHAETRALNFKLIVDKKRQEQALKDDHSQWLELQNEHRFLLQQITLARKLTQLQTQKASEERKRYERGRSTAFQAITFEVDVAESQLQLIRLMASHKRLLNRALLYTENNLNKDIQ